MFSPKAQALKGKTTDSKGIRKIGDFLTGNRRIDNAKNPASAYSMSQRKQQNTTPRDLQK